MKRPSSLGSYLGRAGGTLTILRALPGQRRVPYLDPERADRLRDERVRRMVAFAAAHVPYYRDLFRREGIDPRELRSAQDLAALPLLDKSTVQADPERFRPETRDRDDVVASSSTGSTGRPLRVLHDRRSVLENIAQGERERDVEVALCGRRYGYDVLTVSHRKTADRLLRAYYGRVSFRPLRPRLHPFTVDDPPETIWTGLERIGPRVVRGFGTHLDLVFRTAHAKGVRLRLPRVVNYAGDAMSEGGRRLLEETWGVPVISRYGASEAFKIGFTCEARTGFHLQEDLTTVTIVGEDGRLLPAGERGEIVISNLVNRGMVFLNYRLGDLGRLGGHDCPCGRTARLLRELEGRTDDTVRLPDGRAVHPVLVRLALDRDDLLRFQLVQNTETSFRARLVPADGADFDAVAGPVVAALERVLPGCTVVAERHDELRPENGRKFRSVVPLRGPE